MKNSTVAFSFSAGYVFLTAGYIFLTAGYVFILRYLQFLLLCFTPFII